MPERPELLLRAETDEYVPVAALCASSRMLLVLATVTISEIVPVASDAPTNPECTTLHSESVTSAASVTL